MIKHIYRIAAYITAYEDDEAVKRCVGAINSQSYPVQKILIVDNSQYKYISNSAFIDQNVIVKYCPENIGVSGGLSLAFEWVIKEEYDFLWTFDQDSIVTKDCLSKLLLAYEGLHNPDYLIGIIGPTALDLRNDRIVEGAKFVCDRFTGCKPPIQTQPYECDSPITSGSLVALTAAKAISPRAELFIDGVDLDYGLRLVQKGFYNLIVPDAIMYHNFGNPIKAKFLNIEFILQKYSALRHYYTCRNHTYLCIHFAKRWYFLTCWMRRIKYMIHAILLIGLYDSEQKALKIWACILGTYHGCKGKLGKTWQ